MLDRYLNIFVTCDVCRCGPGPGSVPERWYEFITIARLHFGDWYRGQLREVMVKGCQVWKRPATRVLKESPEWWCSKTWRLAHSLAGVMSLLLCLSLQWPAVVSSEIFFNEGSASGVPPLAVKSWGWRLLRSRKRCQSERFSSQEDVLAMGLCLSRGEKSDKQMTNR